ncbi:NTF2-related export protein-like [Oppia nitens]|uniref:NTF2-related export protein-like n=1 Tax=Oppia nitens TaxID=1686743 RepID=UPI0023DCC5C7|nr:NTF2-related export protein-like [Oppia nitens]
MATHLTSPSTGSSSTASALRITQGCDDGKKFAELFYEKLDKGRHTMGQLFHESANVLWNGNPVTGKANAVTFYESLPTVETQLFSIDAQPVLEAAAGQQICITVVCNGKMKFASNVTRSFTESFLLTAENNVWKVLTDTYRNY